MREFELIEGNNSGSCGSLFLLLFGSMNIPFTGCSGEKSCTVSLNPHPKFNTLQVMPHPATHTEWFRSQHFRIKTGDESKDMTHKPEIRSGSN